jgi:hypothetical protein
MKRVNGSDAGQTIIFPVPSLVDSDDYRTDCVNIDLSLLANTTLL